GSAMGEIVGIAANQIVMMFLLMSVGYALYRTRFLTEPGVAQMSDLVLFVANPVLIARALMRPFDAAVFEGALWVAGVSVVTLLVSVAVGYLAYRDPKDRHAAIGRFSTIFSNTGFIGIPLAQAMVGADGVFYVAVANTVQIVFMWTYGVVLASGDRSQVAPRKVLTNPSLIAMVVGMLCFALSWEPPQLAIKALDSLGNLNTGLVMLVLGANLAKCRLTEVVRDLAVWKACGLRLLVMPLITLALLFVLPRVGIAAQTIVIMYQAMPVAAAASLFAHSYGRDGDFATAVVALSTLCSLATMPLMLLIGSIIL
ncbi:MAG: AEC family transporter, partial [Coriobacteriales bacterium]|nr:AEC family transporter [Coriobacteriales bacterium]